MDKAVSQGCNTYNNYTNTCRNEVIKLGALSQHGPFICERYRGEKLIVWQKLRAQDRLLI